MISNLAALLTTITAWSAVIMLLLVIYGFQQYVRRPRTAPIDFIATGIWLMAVSKLVRVVWWDILTNPSGLQGYEVNWAFDVAMVLACWFMLKGIFILVDQKAPGKYNVLTAVFYPRRLRMWIVSRAEEE